MGIYNRNRSPRRKWQIQRYPNRHIGTQIPASQPIEIQNSNIATMLRHRFSRSPSGIDAFKGFAQLDTRFPLAKARQRTSFVRSSKRFRPSSRLSMVRWICHRRRHIFPYQHPRRSWAGDIHQSRNRTDRTDFFGDPQRRGQLPASF